MLDSVHIDLLFSKLRMIKKRSRFLCMCKPVQFLTYIFTSCQFPEARHGFAPLSLKVQSKQKLLSCLMPCTEQNVAGFHQAETLKGSERKLKL